MQSTTVLRATRRQEAEWKAVGFMADSDSAGTIHQTLGPRSPVGLSLGFPLAHTLDRNRGTSPVHGDFARFTAGKKRRKRHLMIDTPRAAPAAGWVPEARDWVW